MVKEIIHIFKTYLLSFQSTQINDKKIIIFFLNFIFLYSLIQNMLFYF